MPVIVVMAANPNRVRRVPGPLLAVDAPSLLYRAFHALPKTITTPEGTPVNALLGVSNLLLQAVELHDPRAIVLCFGEEAAPYRVELYAGYHADRPEMPEELVPQWQDAPAYFGAFNWSIAHAPELEADDLLGSLAQIETRAGGRALLYTGDRDMFQCVGEDVAVLWPVGAKGEPEVIGPAEVHARYGIGPEQVPDFIALRGDPSDGIPGAKGIGEKTAADLLRRPGTLEATIAGAIRERPAVRKALIAQADDLAMFKDLATLRPVDLERPPDRPTDGRKGADAAEALGMRRLAERLRS
jgi:5'-3' exonuclease